MKHRNFDQQENQESKLREKLTYRARDIAIRSIDILGASFGLVLFSIPMLVIACMIFLEDGAPVFFKQSRVGKDKKPFLILKFRSMYNDPKRASGEIKSADTINSDRITFVTTSVNDTRITTVGKLIRPFHFDELPQLANVLLGSMSLVGVRPDVPVQEVDYDVGTWNLRHRYRPGITGLAQISPNVSSMEERTAYDLQWVQNRSFALYTSILLRTVSKVLKGNSF